MAVGSRTSRWWTGAFERTMHTSAVGWGKAHFRGSLQAVSECLSLPGNAEKKLGSKRLKNVLQELRMV